MSTAANQENKTETKTENKNEQASHGAGTGGFTRKQLKEQAARLAELEAKTKEAEAKAFDDIIAIAEDEDTLFMAGKIFDEKGDVPFMPWMATAGAERRQKAKGATVTMKNEKFPKLKIEFRFEGVTGDVKITFLKITDDTKSEVKQIDKLPKDHKLYVALIDASMVFMEGVEMKLVEEDLNNRQAALKSL